MYDLGFRGSPFGSGVFRDPKGICRDFRLITRVLHRECRTIICPCGSRFRGFGLNLGLTLNPKLFGCLEFGSVGPEV